MKNYDTADEYFRERHDEAIEQENFVLICELAESYAEYVADDLNDEIEELKTEVRELEQEPELSVSDLDTEDIVQELTERGYNVIKTTSLKEQMELEDWVARQYPNLNMRETIYLQY